MQKAEWVIGCANYVAMTVPIKPDCIKLENWKHYKPGEHVQYFKDNELIHWMKCLGFKLLKLGEPECPPRQDIHSFLFKRGQDETKVNRAV